MWSQVSSECCTKPSGFIGNMVTASTILGWAGHVGKMDAIRNACCPWNHGLRSKKSFKLVWRCHQQLLVLRMGNYLWRRMNHKFANGMMWKGNGNTPTLLFSLKRLEIVLQGRRKVKTIVMEHFNDFPFHKSGPANKQHTNQSSNQVGCQYY